MESVDVLQPCPEYLLLLLFGTCVVFAIVSCI